MNSTHILVTLSAIGLLAGCASTSPSARQGGPYVKPGLIMLTADQAEARGIQVKPAADKPQTEPMPAEVQALDASSVVTAPGVKVYTFGRMVDPADRNVMHEAHAVYRRETAPQWKLRAQPGQQIIVGPRVSESRQEPQAPATQEVDSFMADQRKMSQENRQAIEVMFKGIDSLSKQQQQTQRLVLQYMADSKEQKQDPKKEQKVEPQKEAPPKDAPAPGVADASKS